MFGQRVSTLKMCQELSYWLEEEYSKTKSTWRKLLWSRKGMRSARFRFTIQLHWYCSFWAVITIATHCHEAGGRISSIVNQQWRLSKSRETRIYLPWISIFNRSLDSETIYHNHKLRVHQFFEIIDTTESTESTRDHFRILIRFPLNSSLKKLPHPVTTKSNFHWFSLDRVDVLLLDRGFLLHAYLQP